VDRPDAVDLEDTRGEQSSKRACQGGTNYWEAGMRIVTSRRSMLIGSPIYMAIRKASSSFVYHRDR
jgi:hypothetical protein